MSFDAIAPHYRWIERVTAGSLLQRCRTRFIHEIRDAKNILLLGEGRGRFLLKLVRQNPKAKITCVDASARMLSLTRSELEGGGIGQVAKPSNNREPTWSAVAKHSDDTALDARRMTDSPTPVRSDLYPKRVKFIHADILEGDWCNNATRYDAVASHFFLDCFTPEQLTRICATIAGCTTTDACWLISDFCVPDRGWQRARARLILWGLYRFFRVTTRLPARRLTPPGALLQQAGFQLRDRGHFNHGLLHSDVWIKG